jgi:toxin ParE1/3/4
MRLIFRPEATADLRDISFYTRRTFGKRQAKIYLRRIEDRCDALAIRARPAMPVDDVSPGLFRAGIGSHMIFFRIDGDELSIVRVLHQSMHYKDHL